MIKQITKAIKERLSKRKPDLDIELDFNTNESENSEILYHKEEPKVVNLVAKHNPFHDPDIHAKVADAKRELQEIWDERDSHHEYTPPWQVLEDKAMAKVIEIDGMMQMNDLYEPGWETELYGNIDAEFDLERKEEWERTQKAVDEIEREKNQPRKPNHNLKI